VRWLNLAVPGFRPGAGEAGRFLCGTRTSRGERGQRRAGAGACMAVPPQRPSRWCATRRRGQVLSLRDDDGSMRLGSRSARGQGGESYRVTVQSAVAPGGTVQGAYLQLRFSPSERYVRCLRAGADGALRHGRSGGRAGGQTQATVYIYSHREPTPRVLVDRVPLSGRGTAPVSEEETVVPKPCAGLCDAQSAPSGDALGHAVGRSRAGGTGGRRYQAAPKIRDAIPAAG